MPHAVEISENQSIVSAETMKTFYERVGWYQCSGLGETKDAFHARRATMKEFETRASVRFRTDEPARPTNASRTRARTNWR